MCGIAGFIDSTNSDNHGASGHQAQSLLRAMGDAILHRGPDAGDVWFDADWSVGLSHRRLSIQDLSPLGAQPMASASGRYVMAFNGEVYNFRSLRDELLGLGYHFKGHSDTEVMLAAFECWGLDAAIRRFAGMFAFALVDRQAGLLILARDRLGEKPLYYSRQGQRWFFGSELKALAAHPAFARKVNRDALPLLLRHNFIPAPHTIYQGVHKLLPAHYLQIDLHQPAAAPVLFAYWSLEASFTARPFGTAEEAADALEQTLSGIVREQMVADVPLGAFLSGGIDSSSVVALMQQSASRPVKTFTIGFNEPGFNEAEQALAVARHLGTEHTELYVSAADALALIPQLPQIYDEPFADSSQLPTFLVSRMARTQVTVALSGDGGDELLCGYTRYPAYVAAWQRQSGIRAALMRAALGLPLSLMARMMKRWVPGQSALPLFHLIEKLQRRRLLAGADSLEDYYRIAVSYWDQAEWMAPGSHEPDYALRQSASARIKADPMKSLMYQDLRWYLPDDILVKVDRAAMASSLETRVPMLDHRFVEFALGLDSRFNLQGHEGKQLLRKVLYRHVPQALVDRPKRGFAVPVAHWLRHELRDWAEALLEPSRLTREGYWHVAMVRRTWVAHVSGQVDYAFQLWGILMFQAWLEAHP